jgi:hypothetical protein
MLGLKRDEVTGCWRKLHNEELHNLYSSPSIIIMTKSRMRWAWHVARMGEKRMVWTGLIFLRVGTSGGSYEHSNEPSGCIEFWEVLE